MKLSPPRKNKVKDKGQSKKVNLSVSSIIIMAIILIFNSITFAMTPLQITPYIGKICKIYYNGVGTSYGKILGFSFRKGLPNIENIEIVVEEKNALNQISEVYYLVSTIDKIED